MHLEGITGPARARTAFVSASGGRDFSVRWRFFGAIFFGGWRGGGRAYHTNGGGDWRRRDACLRVARRTGRLEKRG